MTTSTVLRFGPFLLDEPNQRLTRGEQVLSLAPKSLSVLIYLIGKAGNLVSKDELLNALWPDVHVGDAVLKTCVRGIRKALADPARSPVFIETVHRRGYRFIAPVTVVTPGARATYQAATGDVPPAVDAHSGAMDSLRPVGREVELERLERSLDRMVKGERQVVFITGEPGVGKTTLVDMFLDRVQRRRIWATRGQCLSLHGAGEAYMPVLEALARLGRREEGARLVAVLRRHAPTWLVQMPSLVDAGGSRRAPAGDSRVDAGAHAARDGRGARSPDGGRSSGTRAGGSALERLLHAGPDRIAWRAVTSTRASCCSARSARSMSSSAAIRSVP